MTNQPIMPPSCPISTKVFGDGRPLPMDFQYWQMLTIMREAPANYLGLLMASPTCTHHSVARGGKPTSDQQRSDPWHIITWLTELRVKRLIIENVWEFTGWGPVDENTGRPIKARKGEYFHAWIETLRRLGFEPEWRKLNAADYGDATTRSRFILMARSDGRKVSWPMPTHRRRDQIDHQSFPGVMPWRPARDIIDWSIKGRSIFGRKKPLVPKTMARIYAGAVKHGWPEPFLVILRRNMVSRGIDLPLPTITANAQHIALVEPFVLSQASGGAARAVSQPIPTQTTGGNGASHALIMAYYGANASCSSSDDPLPTVTTKDRFGMIVPVTHSDSSNRARDVDDPLPTLTTANRGELAFITAQFGERDGQAPRVHGLDQPVPTICATGRVNLVEATEQYDILFRMLEPHELAAAMGFGDYDFAGTKTDKIKQIGNAVSVAKMRACVGAIMDDAAAPEIREAAE